jgi:putative endonuclease
MTTMQKTIGDRAEDYALKFLTQKGLRLLERNYECKLGEIDLIMQDNEHIIFVEVRCRTRSRFGSAADSVTPTKIKKLIRTATIYLQAKKWLHKYPSRFDIVAIDFSKTEKETHWIKNAFTA